MQVATRKTKIVEKYVFVSKHLMENKNNLIFFPKYFVLIKVV
jgi:hypothetical protein